MSFILCLFLPRCGLHHPDAAQLPQQCGQSMDLPGLQRKPQPGPSQLLDLQALQPLPGALVIPHLQELRQQQEPAADGLHYSRRWPPVRRRTTAVPHSDQLPQTHHPQLSVITSWWRQYRVLMSLLHRPWWHPGSLFRLPKCYGHQLSLIWVFLPSIS